MAPQSYEAIINSHLFTLLVGQNKKEIKVHAAAISSLSSALNGLINGNMAEAKDKCAVLDDVAPETFLLLCEYAYSGDYNVALFVATGTYDENGTASDSQAAPGIRVNEVVGVDSPVLPIPTSTNRFSNRSNNTQTKTQSTGWGGSVNEMLNSATKRTKLLRSFDDKNFTSQPRFTQPLLPDVPGIAPSVSFAFKDHARLYVLANKYGIDSLEQLCLSKIHKMLAALTPRLNLGAAADSVLDLIRYIYDYNGNDPITAQHDACRNLLVLYVACHHDLFSKRSAFQDLLYGGGDFVMDLWEIITEQLLLE